MVGVVCVWHVVIAGVVEVGVMERVKVEPQSRQIFREHNVRTDMLP